MSVPWAYRLNGVTHRYGGRTALHIDHLEIARGEVMALLGPTGAGKSTLLKLLAATTPATAGNVSLGETPLDPRLVSLEVLRRITLVFQQPLLLSGTVRANVEYPLGLRHQSRRSEKVEAMLDRLRLSDLSSRSAKSLSGGETQLVALARALVLEPEVLLLDEPTSNLDPARVALVEEVLAEFQRRTGATFVWATHNIFQARRVAQSVALLLDGRLVETARNKEFFENPADPRSAAFVRGEMVY
jgi:tungstate transport system ATP-binding protein